MANNYTNLSTFYCLEPGQLEEAKRILWEAAVAWMKSEDCPFCADDEEPWTQLPGHIKFEDKGIWFAHDESIDTEMVAMLISALQKRFSNGEPFFFEYCDWCSKPRIGEFCGGAYAILPNGNIQSFSPLDAAKAWAEKAMKRSKRRKEVKR